MIKNTLSIVLTALLVIGFTPVMAVQYKLDISLETGPTHIRNESIVKFAETLEQRSNGRLQVRVFHAASQYKGSAVPVAIAQGSLDMGVPGLWHIGKLVPETGVPLLPMFYGASIDTMHKIWDGPSGDHLNALIEKKTRGKVIGRWLDLGYGTVYTTKKKIVKTSDMEGMKMRVPGGAATVYRYKVFGANPVNISFGDVPQALQRGTVDGLMTNQEGARSAKMWESGLKYGFYDRQAFYQYVPVISLKAWNKFPKDIQDLIVDSWEQAIDSMRKLVAQRQLDARKENTANGIITIEADPADLKQMGAKLMAAQPEIVEQLGLDKDFVKQVKAELDKLQ